MAERRSLVEAVKPKPDTNRAVEEEFIYGEKTKPVGDQPNPTPKTEAAAAKPTPAASREPLTTRIRADLAQALKRSSLQRQLQGIEPNTVQDILEEALEPWLKSNGYLQ